MEGIMEEGKQESVYFEASSVCFDGLFADLGELKERGGGLTISMSHPALVSIVDKLSALGMEELMKKRFYDQLESLRHFTKMHGHCLVPADHPTLGDWVRLQHKHYMLCKKRLPSPLTSKRFTKLKEISGFDEFGKPREESKDDLIGAKLSAKTLGAQEAQGKASPSDTSLALDEKIRLKKAMNKVRLMAKATKGFSSTEKKKLPDKEVVAAQIRRKRAKGTSHRLAVRNSQRMTKSFISATSDNNSILDLSATSGRSKECEEEPGPATEGAPKDEPPPIVDAFEEVIRKKLAEDNRGQSASVDSTGGRITPAVDGHGRRLEKMMRKLTAEGGRGQATVAGEGAPFRRVTSEGIAESATVGEGEPRQRVTFNNIVKHISERGKNNRSIDGSGEATRKNMGTGDRSRSMAMGMGGGGNGPSRRSEDQHLGALVPAKASIAGSTFEGQLSVCLKDIYGDRFGGDGSSVAEEATGQKIGAGDLGRSMPVGTGGGRDEPCWRSDDRRLGASAPANTSIARSTFDDRLRRKLDGESLEEIYRDLTRGAGDDDSISSLTSFDGFPRRHTSRSGWMDKLNGPGWDSRDDMGVPGRLTSWTNLDETLPPGRRYSRWKLVFCRSDCDDGSVQSDCVSSVLNTIIYSERWHVVPKENSDVALEMTTRTPDEHKTVELYLQQLNDLYSRSDFYFY